MQDFEKLGLFYLGRSDEGGRDLVLYDSRDLVTHAVCVGMTGSGKTGLCLGLLEEAAIDHVPAIAIDPKGDIADLLLTFPKLRGEDFAPWVDEGEARKAGLTTAEFAEAQAELWRTGLADWGQDGDRIERLRQSAEFRIYTPGSSAGLPLSILKSFAAPPAAVRDDPEAVAERAGTTATSLLGLLGVDADPMTSREHILLANLLAESWKAGADLDVSSLIPTIQNPPFRRVGVVDLESFFPAKDRFALAMRLNNLLASPKFGAWLQGEPLDVASLLNAPDGKPRVSIVSIAHLDESERMFFVSLLLNEILGWARAQSGTSSLRALLYMDEIFGYFPPVANPPSKRPLLTLLKQARAYGLGVVLATQNPADLDYKGLSNTGTWFIGRLQAERDKLRVLEGLEGASASQSAAFDRSQMDALLSGLAKRTFLMHNVHEDHPQVFESRWVLSYLRGPLTRQQIKTLMDPLKAAESAVSSSPPAASRAPGEPSPAPSLAPVAPTDTAEGPPLLPPEIPHHFLPVRGRRPEGATLLYQPMVLGSGDVYYNDTKSGVSLTERVARLAPLSPEAKSPDWSEAAELELEPDELDNTPSDMAPARYEPLPASAAKARSYPVWTKAWVDALFRGESLELLKSPSVGAWSAPGESERDFRLRLQQSAKESRDKELDRLRARYAPKLSALEARIRRAEQAVERERAQAQNSGLSSLIRFGTTVMGAIMGRKTLSASTIDKAGTTLRNIGQTVKETGDVSRARDAVDSLRQEYAELEAEFLAESKRIERTNDPLAETLEPVVIRPKKTNITPKLIALAWAPSWILPDGTSRPAWK